MLNKTIIETFQNNCNEIYKIRESADPTYLLIVDDVYSNKSNDCYDLYYILLGKTETYFELKLLTKEDLQEVQYMNPIKIY